MAEETTTPKREIRDKELIALEKIYEAARILFDHHTSWHGSGAVKGRAAVSRIVSYVDNKFGTQFE